MATKSARLRNEKRKKMANSQKAAREDLRKKTLNFDLSDEERDAARRSLQGLSRNGAGNRVRVRCILTGRSRGNYRKFQLCRNKFRELALMGQIPGVTKASW